MRFLADENVDRPIVARLREEGHAVLHILEMDPGISDDQVIDRVNRERALLLTADKDFGELVFRQGRIIHGVVLIRLAGLSSQHKAEAVAATVEGHAGELIGGFTVVAPGLVRIRKQVLDNNE